MAQRFRHFLLLTVALVLLSAPPAVSAHGFIVRSIPEDRAALERAPARIQYWFSEGLEPAFSTLTVRDQAGNVVATGGVDPQNDALLSARLPSDLPDGAYMNELRIAFASDGHVIVESRVFFVGQVVGGVGGLAASDQAVPLEVVWRALVGASTALLLGAFVVYALVLVPAWGSAAYAAGLLPPRVMGRLNALVIAALAGALAGNLLALLQQSMVFFGADAGRVLAEGLWNVVRIGTRFGDTWNARMLLLLLIGALHAASLYVRAEQPGLVRPFWIANAWAAALLAGTLSLAAHAAGSQVLPWLALLSDWLHLVAVGFWTGGLAALAFVLPTALAPYAGDARRAALLAALRRFSPIAAAGAGVVVATGIYNSANWFVTPNDVNTTYGGALAVKVLLVAALLALGALHHVALRPQRYARFAALSQRVGFVGTLPLETLAALLVLVAAGWLSATPVPKPETASVPPLTAAQTLDGGYTLNAAITPGGPGVNTYDVLITGESGAAVDGLTVRLRAALPELDRRGDWLTAEPMGDGLYSAAGDEIDRSGVWWTLIEVEGLSEARQRAAFAWSITQAAAVVQTRSPNAFNLLALAGVLIALGYALMPSARRVVRTLDLSPASVTIAVGASAACVGIVVIGVLASQQSAANYEASLNPPPAVVNAVLPAADSLARGQQLAAAACPGWDGAPDFVELTRRLSRTRDEALFALTREGWWSLPPCRADLTDAQRWDIVNYLRSYES